MPLVGYIEAKPLVRGGLDGKATMKQKTIQKLSDQYCALDLTINFDLLALSIILLLDRFSQPYTLRGTVK